MKKALLITILVIGFQLRVINIQTNPPSLYGDELTIVYDAYSLLSSGADQLGNFLPLTFQMGAGRPAGYVYASIPFVSFFGPTALGVRGLSIFSGMGIVILIYLLTRKIFTERVGLIAASLTAFSPWGISLSRGGFEAHFALFLSLTAIYFFTLAKTKPVLYIFSALIFGLTIHTYPTYKLVLPLFLPLLLWYQGGIRFVMDGRVKLYFLSGVVILLFLGVLSARQTLTAGSEARFSQINVFGQGHLKNIIEQKVNYERTVSFLPTDISKFFHNKPIEYGKVVFENYLRNFSIDFLFIHGDGNPRHNMATIGQLYFVDLFLIFISLVVFLHKQKRQMKYLLIWLGLAPIPAALVDVPHALRSSFMLPPLILLSSLGLNFLLEQRRRVLIIFVSLLFIIQLTFFVQKLYFLSPNEYSAFWSYPAKLASKLALDKKNDFQYVILSDKIENIEFAYPVYAQIPPDQVIDQNQHRSSLGVYQFKKFDNVYIGYIEDGEIEKFIDSLDGSAIFIGSFVQSKFLSDFEILEGLDKTKILIWKRKK